jgi:L-alanine-DL-glutamate epimerase-like enolase superfamily enzyme
MKINNVETFILHVPVTRNQIADSTHRTAFWGAPGVIIETDSGIRGYGYTGTHAHLPADRLITDCIRDCYAPLLIGAGHVQSQVKE